MISLDEYARHDALGLAELVSKKQVTPQELLTAAFLAIEKTNPVLNAVVKSFADVAVQDIKSGLKPGPFRGVPILVDELSAQVKNIEISRGSRLAQGYVQHEDSNLISRFRRAGFVIAGTTQVSEFGIAPTTESILYGPTRNPYNTSSIAGGACGGSAAAVASGMVPIAKGNDSLGSIRLPASCNGLVGLKPSRDRIPTGPNISDPMSGMSVDFAFSKSVRDSAALLDAIAGADAGAPGQPVPPARKYLDELAIKPGRLRIAWTTKNPNGVEIDPECKRAVLATVKLLTNLGHELVEDHPRFDWDVYVRSLHIIMCVNVAASIEAIGTTLHRKPGPDNLETATLAYYEHGRRFTAVDFVNAVSSTNAIARKMGAFFEQVDIFLTPTMPQLPIEIGELDQNRPGIGGADWTLQTLGYNSFTPIFNTTGQPAISLPLHMSSSGLPIGLQFAARFGEEAVLFRVASQLEQACPWSSIKPRAHCSAIFG